MFAEMETYSLAVKLMKYSNGIRSYTTKFPQENDLKKIRNNLKKIPGSSDHYFQFQISYCFTRLLHVKFSITNQEVFIQLKTCK